MTTNEGTKPVTAETKTTFVYTMILLWGLGFLFGWFGWQFLSGFFTALFCVVALTYNFRIRPKLR